MANAEGETRQGGTQVLAFSLSRALRRSVGTPCSAMLVPVSMHLYSGNGWRQIEDIDYDPISNRRIGAVPVRWSSPFASPWATRITCVLVWNHLELAKEDINVLCVQLEPGRGTSVQEAAPCVTRTYELCR